MSPIIHHGTASFQRGIDAPRSRYHAQGTFGRLFPTLPPLFLRTKTEEELREALLELGKPGGVMESNNVADPPNEQIAAGFVFFGQFIDHDITFDTTSSFERQNDPEGIVNFRTPALELDSVYGSGPAAMPFLYQGDGAHLLVEAEFGRDQLPRASTGTGIIGDPRNDENLLISQLHLAFLKFHNRVVDRLAQHGVGGMHLFKEAQRIVRWHYQWIVLHEFLPLIVGQNLVDEIYVPGRLKAGRKFYDWRHEPFIPVEFAVAAYRFGHSQIPGQLKVNDVFKVNGQDEIPLFNRAVWNPGDPGDPDDLSSFGGRAERRFVDWQYLFPLGNGQAQASKIIDTLLARPLFDLPFIPQGQPANPISLAARNLLRGHVFGLPSGQAVANAMGEQHQLTPGDLQEVNHLGFDQQTPLWYYILKEAQVIENGTQLGPVGGRIVAEVLIGLLEGDRLSFLRADPQWKPEDENLGTDRNFNMAQLVV